MKQDEDDAGLSYDWVCLPARGPVPDGFEVFKQVEMNVSGCRNLVRVARKKRDPIPE